MLHVLSSLANKIHTNPLSLTSLSQLNLLAMGLRPLSIRDTIQPWMGRWPSSTPTLESERCSRVEGRGIDPESCDYAPKLCSIIWNWKWPSYNWGDDKTNRSAGSARKVHLKPLHREVPTIMCCSMSRFPISATNVATNPRSHLCTPLEKHSMRGTNKSMWSNKFKLAFSSMRWKINECSILSRR